MQQLSEAWDISQPPRTKMVEIGGMKSEGEIYALSKGIVPW